MNHVYWIFFNPMENNQYKFKRQCVFRSGKFEGFYGWKSIVGHSVALFGLAYGIRTAWLYVVKPAGKAVTPSFQNLYNCKFNLKI